MTYRIIDNNEIHASYNVEVLETILYETWQLDVNKSTLEPCEDKPYGYRLFTHAGIRYVGMLRGWGSAKEAMTAARKNADTENSCNEKFKPRRPTWNGHHQF
jgi:hypothetical protein